MANKKRPVCSICQAEAPIPGSISAGAPHKTIEGIVVCRKCWVDGYGRLPDMPLPKAEEARVPYVKGK